MDIETVDDLANKICDWVACYGACKSTDPNGCDNANIFCCRVGAMMILPDMIRRAVENSDRLGAAGYLINNLPNNKPCA